jgi:hypothetical protein
MFTEGATLPLAFPRKAGLNSIAEVDPVRRCRHKFQTPLTSKASGRPSAGLRDAARF